MPTRRPIDLRAERGTAAVEFALVLPLLMLVLALILHMGKAVHYWMDETHLANEAARFAAVDRNPGASGTLQANVLSQADSNELRTGGGTVAGPAQVCIDFPAGTAKVGDPVRATVRVTYDWIPILQPATRAASTTITSTSTMRLEAAPSNYSAGCT